MNESTMKKPTLPLPKRRDVSIEPEAWVRATAPAPGVTTPFLLTPTMPGVTLASWAREQLPRVLELLHRHGALLFRGFGIDDAAKFAEVTRAVAGEPLAYEERSSPRSAVSGNVYTSTDHPPTERIFMHNEQSYNQQFPLRLLFCCVTAAQAEGSTPLADSRRIFRRVPVAIRERFGALGYLYVRNFGASFGLPWQVAFQTDERAEVEAYCRRNAIEVEWRSGDRLRTRQKRRVAGLHPFTGEPTWFNHATFFHVSTLPCATGDALRAALGDDELPNNTYYGDGSPIEADVLEELRAAYDGERVELPWQRGDVMLIDNMLCAHGRAPFVGPRLVLAAMATPIPWSAVPELPVTR
ncbi:MAG TPA: TauD/TfdA family dioxygenase [Polyangia bacterium]|nr:TauD/TfdA family dioxygenase [Polyangia bacterium]